MIMIMSVILFVFMKFVMKTMFYLHRNHLNYGHIYDIYVREMSKNYESICRLRVIWSYGRCRNKYCFYFIVDSIFERVA